MALRQKDIVNKQNVEMFLELLDSEWSKKISSAALRTLSDGQFNKAPVIPVTEDLIKLMDLVYVRGKWSRKVPILLTAEIVNAMKALVKTRDAVGVPNENKYVFAAPSRCSLNYLCGPDCLNAVVKSCQLKNPIAIKSAAIKKNFIDKQAILHIRKLHLPMEQAEVTSDEECEGDNSGVGEHIDADMESEPVKED
eukprot:gene6572-12108_t